MAPLEFFYNYSLILFILCQGRKLLYCDICWTDVTVQHILKECTYFSHERRANLLRGRSMTELLCEIIQVETIVQFLKEEDFYLD